jgi:hypothetical protein
MRRARALATASLLFLAFSVLGCDWRQLSVRIPDFESKQVLGVGVWRTSGGAGYEREFEIHFSPPRQVGAQEVITYTVSGGLTSSQIDAIERDSQNPDQITVHLWMPLLGGGSYKVTTFNDAGESPLSDETVSL